MLFCSFVKCNSIRDVFGYNDYRAFKHFTDKETGFATRIKDNANYDIVRVREVFQKIHSGIFSDQIIEIAVKVSKER